MFLTIRLAQSTRPKTVEHYSNVNSVKLLLLKKGVTDQLEDIIVDITPSF